MYAQLGNYKFEGLVGFDSLSKSSFENFVRHEVISGKPILQHLGGDLDEYRLTLPLNAKFCVPEDEINILNQFRKDGEVLPFNTGAGSYLGDFVIESVDEETVMTDAQGNIIQVILSIVLIEFVDPDPLGSMKQKSQEIAFAVDSTRVVPVRPSIQSVSPANDVLSSQQAAQAQANSIVSNLQELETNPSKFESVFNAVTKRVDQFRSAVGTIQDKFTQYKQIEEMVENADAVLNQTLIDAGNIIENIQSGNLSGAIAAGSAFSNSAGQMNNSFSNVKLFAAGRGVLS